ncbi:MAG: tetratricopeptide repeat protein [Dichotomicrobium sp.]
MSRHDQCGHPVQITSPEALDAWNATVRGFLAHSARMPDHLQAVLETEPGFALARIAKGFFLLLLGRSELDAKARELAAEIEALAQQGALDPREALYMAALRDWLGGCPSRAAARLDEVHAGWPGDALALKLSHAIRFMMGDRFAMRESLEDVLGTYRPDHPLAGYVMGCHAFALEETGAYTEAERAGRRALELAPDDAWALHAVTHVYEMTGQSSQGRRYVMDNRQAWCHCNNFGYHVWWHLALFHLDSGDYADVLALYDDRVRCDRTDDYRDIANATSLLARLELEGVDVGGRWEELADIAERRVNDGCVVFADLHYMLALTGAGRDVAAARLERRLREAAQAPAGEMDLVAARAGAPVAEGLRAFRQADYDSACTFLATARPRLQSIGGSHAQRDVFERILIDTAILAGATVQARRLIEERGRMRGAVDNFAKLRLDRIAKFGGHSESAA